MTDIIVDGTVRVSWVTAIAVIASPTAAELTAGILLQHLLTPDGLVGLQQDSGSVPTGSLGSTFSSTRPGRDAVSGPMLRFKKQLGADPAYAALRAKNTVGFVVIRYYIAESTAWTAAQECEVWPVETARRRVLAPAENETAKYEIPLAITSQPQIDAVVA